MKYIEKQFIPYVKSLMDSKDHQQLVELEAPIFNISSMSEKVQKDLTEVDIMSIPIQICEKLNVCNTTMGIYGQDSPKALI